MANNDFGLGNGGNSSSNGQQSSNHHHNSSIEHQNSKDDSSDSDSNLNIMDFKVNIIYLYNTNAFILISSLFCFPISQLSIANSLQKFIDDKKKSFANNTKWNQKKAKTQMIF